MSGDFELRDLGEGLREVRGELALLRRAVERLASDSGAQPLDYSPTLGKITRSISELAEAVKVIGDAPAIAMSQEQMIRPLMSAGLDIRAQARTDLEAGLRNLLRITDMLIGLYRSAVTRRQQVRHLIYATGFGALLGLSLWMSIVPPMARALPKGWGAPESLALAVLNLPTWDAGMQLLARADRPRLEQMTLGGRIVEANGTAVGKCWRQWREKRRPSPCYVALAPS